jgi:hypothetical protein
MAVIKFVSPFYILLRWEKTEWFYITVGVFVAYNFQNGEKNKIDYGIWKRNSKSFISYRINPEEL